MLLLCSRCGKVVILNVFRTGMNAVLFLPLLSCVLRYTGSSGLTRVFDYDLYRRTWACFVYLCHHPRSHFTKLLTRALFFGPYHCSYVFVPCLAFRVHVAGEDDLNTTTTFVAGVRSTSLPLYSGSSIRARAALCNQVFLKHNLYPTECFLKQWICMEHCIWNPVEQEFSTFWSMWPNY